MWARGPCSRAASSISDPLSLSRKSRPGPGPTRFLKRVHHDAGTSGQHSYRGASAKLIILVCLFYPVESRPTPINPLRFLAAGGPRLRRDALDLAADGLGELGRCSLHAKGAFFEEPIWNLCETQPVTVVHRRRASRTGSTSVQARWWIAMSRVKTPSTGTWCRITGCRAPRAHRTTTS